MKNNNNIEELIQKKLQHFETEVSADVWSKIDSTLDKLQPPVDTSIVSETLVQSAGTNISAWVAGIATAVVGLVTVGIFVFNDTNNNQNSTSDKSITPVEEVITLGSDKIESPEQAMIAEESIKSDETITNRQINNIGEKTEESDGKIIPENETLQPNSENTEFSNTRRIENEIINKAPGYDAMSEKGKNDNNSESAPEYSGVVVNESSKAVQKVPEVIKPESQTEIIEVLITEQENLNTKKSSVGPVPNVFTPNGDGMNDQFVFETENIAELRVHIYNSKGDLVFVITDSDKWYWDGILSNGQPAEIGTYYYAVYATGFDKQKHQQKGSLYLNR